MVYDGRSMTMYVDSKVCTQCDISGTTVNNTGIDITGHIYLLKSTGQTNKWVSYVYILTYILNEVLFAFNICYAITFP